METEGSDVSRAEELKVQANEAFKGHKSFFWNLLLRLLLIFLEDIYYQGVVLGVSP